VPNRLADSYLSKNYHSRKIQDKKIAQREVSILRLLGESCKGSHISRFQPESSV